jgi:hypothetical protein
MLLPTHLMKVVLGAVMIVTVVAAMAVLALPLIPTKAHQKSGAAAMKVILNVAITCPNVERPIKMPIQI